MKNQSSEKLEKLKNELHNIVDKMSEYQVILVLSFVKELFKF